MERLKLSWLDLKRGIVNVETAKNGIGRTLKLKNNTLAMLKDYLPKHDFNLTDSIFPSSTTIRNCYTKIRKKTANKLKKPELLRISLYSFRHYFATMLYHKTKDILLVKQKLGHRRLETTLIYTHLVNFQDDEFIARTASTKEEALKLIEAGFEYITEMHDIKLFRKRK